MLKDTELLIFGTDSKGRSYEQLYVRCCKHMKLEVIIEEYKKLHPLVIHIAIDIALPDPDFTRSRHENRNLN